MRGRYPPPAPCRRTRPRGFDMQAEISRPRIRLPGKTVSPPGASCRRKPESGPPSRSPAIVIPANTRNAPASRVSPDSSSHRQPESARHPRLPRIVIPANAGIQLSRRVPRAGEAPPWPWPLHEQRRDPGWKHAGMTGAGALHALRLDSALHPGLSSGRERAGMTSGCGQAPGGPPAFTAPAPRHHAAAGRHSPCVEHTGAASP